MSYLDHLAIGLTPLGKVQIKLAVSLSSNPLLALTLPMLRLLWSKAQGCKYVQTREMQSHFWGRLSWGMKSLNHVLWVLNIGVFYRRFLVPEKFA